MKAFDYVITDEVGIHAGPAGLLGKEAKGLTAKARITKDEKSVDLTRVMEVMGLGVKKGTKVTVSVEGDEEELAIIKLEEFFKANL